MVLCPLASSRHSGDDFHRCRKLGRSLAYNFGAATMRRAKHVSTERAVIFGRSSGSANGMDTTDLAGRLNQLLRGDYQDELRETIRDMADLIHDNVKKRGADSTSILLQYESLGPHLQESVVLQYVKRYGPNFPGTIPETPSASRRIGVLQHGLGEEPSQSSDDQISPTTARLMRLKSSENKSGVSQMGTSPHSVSLEQF